VPVTVHDRDCFLESFVDLSERKKLEMLREDVERIARHDLKTPLTAVIGFSSILLDTAPLAGEEREMLDMIRTAGQRMLRMINRSLDLFKMETGQYVPELQEVDLAAAVSAAVTELSGLARRRSVSVDVAWPGGAAADSLDECRVVAMGEEGLCATILENLLKNALEAAPPGSRVRIGLGLGDGRAWVSINNPGEVRPEVARRFFEKYATAGKRGGTGLGTYSARLMATTMGGTIELATSAADGTTLLLRLPAA
jgi:signal transduction histidine kinase